MPTAKIKTSQLLKTASETALTAGEILKDGFTRVRHIKMKGRIDPVTEFDVKSENHIKNRVKLAFPDHDFLAEESGMSAGDSAYRWIVDPLDGTVNYAHEFPVYCVSIAVEYEGEIVVGVVYDPERDELFAAGQGTGATLNGKRIHVSDQNRLQRSLLATGFAYDVQTARRNNLGLFARMVKSAQAVRRLGSAALDLCWVACGRLDGFWELDLHPWDTAAAKLIVTEAGGKVTRFDGASYSIFDADILASNRRIHRQMQDVLLRSKGRRK